MKPLGPGSELDGFVVDECIHHGSMADLYRVHCAPGAPDPGFPLVMKVPRMAEGDDAQNIVSLEVEHQVLPALSGPHVPRFVAAGDLERLPYLVMEYVPGRTLDHWLEPPVLPAVEEVVQIGVALAHAVHHLHQQNTVHLDLKPSNVLVRADGRVLLLDFGLSCHAHYPDLLVAERRRPLGSPGWMAPEQVVGVRGDPRSDVFAIGVILYQLLTRELPFGEPVTTGGLRRRLWMEPPPPRRYRPELPPWLQEVVLRCLAPQAAQRYPSAAHLAFDLQHPQLVPVSTHGKGWRGASVWTLLKRWVGAAGMRYPSRPSPERQIAEVPIVMVAVPTQGVSDATLRALREAVARSLGTRPGTRLACVTVISPGVASPGSDNGNDPRAQRRCLAQLRQWAQPLERPGHQTACHVLKSGDVAQALIDYARGNRVSVIVMGAPKQGLQTEHFTATVPVRVAKDAPCTVILVRQPLPVEQPASLARDP